MRWLWAAGFLLRRLRAEAGVVALLLVLVTVTSFLFAGAPRLFNLVADEALVHELRAAAAVERNLELASVTVPPTGTDPLGALDAVGRGYLGQLPDSIRPLIGQRRVSATTPRFEIAEPPNYTVFLALRYQDGLEDAIQVIDGRLPAATGEQLPPAFESDDSPSTPAIPPPRIEVAVSQATATETGLTVGASLLATLDGTDRILRGVLTRQIEVRFEVVGIFSVADPAAEVWYEDRSLQRANIEGSDEFPIAYATALVASETYPDLVPSGLPLAVAWRYLLAPERADVGQLDSLRSDLLRLQSQATTSSFEPLIDGSLSLRTGLLDVIGRYQAQRAASEAVLSVAAVGPFVLATGAIGMVAIMLVLRRRNSLELARSRGASGLLLLAAQLWEALLLAGSAALLGLLLAALIVPGRESPISATLALGTGAAAVAVLVAATWPAARRPLGQARRPDPPLLPASPRRLVLELTGVGLAVASVLLLQQRGLVIGGRGAAAAARFDPFLAAVPVLAGLATGVVAMRLYPLPIRALSWLAARRRDLVPVMGLRTVGRHSAAANLPLLVLMLTAAFGSFASVVLSSIDRGQADAAQAQTGADYRIEVGSGGLDLRAALQGMPGVEAVAGAHIDPAATYADTRLQRSQVVLHAVDTDAYTDVAVGTPLEVAWPTGFAAEPTGGPAGTPESPIPAIMSQRLPSGSQPLALGGTFTVEVGGGPLTFVVVERRATFPGVRADAAFVVAPFDLLQEAVGDDGLALTVLLVRGASEIEPALTTLVGERSPSSEVTSRYAAYLTLREAPFVAMVTDGFGIALAAAVAYAALAVLAALALTGARRSQDIAFLRTLGLSARQALGLTVVEHGPPVVLALVPGIGLGIALAALLAPGLGLDSFVGVEADFTITIAWGEIALVGVALVIMVAVAGATSSWLGRRARAVDALRIGAE